MNRVNVVEKKRESWYECPTFLVLARVVNLKVKICPSHKNLRASERWCWVPQRDDICYGTSWAAHDTVSFRSRQHRGNISPQVDVEN